MLVVTSLASSDNSSQDEGFRTIAAYNFNHPPNVDYNPLPVDVVYEQKKLEEKSSDDVITTTEYYEEIIDDSEITKEDTSTESLNFKTELKPKGRSLFDGTVQSVTVANAFKVQVDDTIVGKNRIVTRKPSKGRRRQQQETIGPLKSIPSSSTVKPFTTTPSQNERISLLPVQENQRNINKRTRERDPVVPIIESENYIYSHKGNFHYSYEGGDGTKAFEQGELRRFDDDTAGEAVSGSFSYKDRDGNDFSLSYTADENGYRPVGAHLPTPPPIPPAIARALQYLATKPTESATEIYY